MAKVEMYRKLIQEILIEYCQLLEDGSDEQTEVQTVFDTERDHYQLVHAGWHKKLRQYGCLIHIDIKDEKIWIQYDGTEAGVANELAALGVPKSDIVLAYLSSFARQHTEFAVA